MKNETIKGKMDITRDGNDKCLKKIQKSHQLKCKMRSKILLPRTVTNAHNFYVENEN